MKDAEMTREQLTAELNNLRKRIHKLELEQQESQYTPARSERCDELVGKILSKISLGISAYRVDGRCIWTNEAMASIIGTTIEGVLSQNFRKITSWKKSGLLLDAERVLAEGGHRTRQLHVVSTFGREIWLDSECSRFTFNKAPHLLLVVRDITLLKQMERRVADRNQAFEKEVLSHKFTEQRRMVCEEKFSKLFHISPAWITVRSLADGRFVEVNEAFLRTFGFKREEVIGRTPVTVGILKLDRGSDWLEELQIGSEIRNREIVLFTKQGEERYSVFSTTVLKLDHETCSLSLGLDITEQKNAYQALRRREKEYRILVETMNEGITVLDDKGTVSFVNDKMAELLGYQKHELIGQPAANYFDEENKKILAEQLARRLMGHYKATYEITFTGKGGKKIPVIASVNAIRDSEGKVTGSFGVVTDITERKIAEDKIKAALQEKEVLLREIHHRVKNNLAAISSLLRLQANHARDDFHKQMFNDAQDRMRSIALAHESLYQTENVAHIDMREYVERLVNHLFFATQGLGTGIIINTDLEKIHLTLDKAVPLGSIVNELVSNALRHAFPNREQGLITVSLGRKRPSEFQLIVKDDGIGMPERVNVETTTSFGLHLVMLFVQQLDGQITVAGDNGTEFRIRFGAVS